MVTIKGSYKRIVPEDSFVYVIYSNFIRFTSINEDGGAILYQTTYERQSLLHIKSCLFYDCHSERNAGAISMIGSGECFIEKICGEKCTAIQYGKEKYNSQFDRIELDQNNHNKQIHMNETSVIDIYNPNYGYSINHRHGIIIHKSLNSSNNYVLRHSGALLKPLPTENNYSIIVQYCLFVNDTSTEYTTLCFFNETETQFLLLFSNFIENSQSLPANAIFLSDGPTTVENCIFKDNKADKILQVQNDCNLTLISCIFDDDISNNKFSGIIDTSSLTVSQNHIIYMQLIACEAVLIYPQIFTQSQSIYPRSYSFIFIFCFCHENS